MNPGVKGRRRNRRDSDSKMGGSLEGREWRKEKKGNGIERILGQVKDVKRKPYLWTSSSTQKPGAVRLFSAGCHGLALQG